MSEESKTEMDQAKKTVPEAQQFIIERLYIKDASFESPNAPSIFQDWNPDTNLQLNSNTNRLAEDQYEVELTITVTVKSNDKTAFLVEIKQGGIFLIRGYPQEQMGHILASYCPGSLFPYIREAIASLVSKGGFPELHLSPINFDALYAQNLQEQQQRQAQAQKAETSH